MDGFVNFLKPPGMTSHDAVGYARRQLGEKKVGHAGTLDPGAAGVLPIAVGRATRLIEYMDSVEKAYRAELVFGFATDSGDDSGSVVERAESFAMPEREQLLEAFHAFTGTITQVPPAHSAIKINGRRACDLLREGRQVEIPSRQVQIHSLELLQVGKNHISFDVVCSKGTYIRSLCTDLGAHLGVPATMSFLVRRAVGSFALEEAVTAEQLAELKEGALLPMDGCLGHLPRYDLRSDRLKAFSNGLLTHDRQFQMQHKPEENVILRVYCNDEFIGIGHFDVEKAAILPDKVIAR
ncbi:MAG: tRNA pseudouridine(55) synthase TruB [Anaerovibrio sp.]|uniref:tRNA pseudouridine(55) synthase TruB n=1 Tax=Anaerovibrio sp. TaxID=1872532 RepID=UPI0026392EE9|nr:tRNA pseudouridine(55) synthase TruB [Anaerovibrio sp.]MDD7678815.1 tRNA pseudouridine(55) synthase TruB [Anaerovibrio sp.]MDY2603512.1 tRNA pseudouridine(55) synthase TruB [Anaerovibrio sp.]